MSVPTVAEAMALAERITEAARTRNIDDARACYTPDATLWINVTGTTIGIEDHFAGARGLRAKINDVRYEDIRVLPFEGGFVQLHRAVGAFINGIPFDIPACFIVTMRDGKVAHRAEYIDATPFLQVSEPTASLR